MTNLMPFGPWRLDLAMSLTSLRKKDNVRNAHNKQLQDSRQRTCKWHAREQFQTDWLRQQSRLQLFVNADKWSHVRFVQLQRLTQVSHYVSVDVTKSLNANVRLHCDIYEERLRAASWQTFTNEELGFTVLLAFYIRSEPQSWTWTIVSVDSETLTSLKRVSKSRPLVRFIGYVRTQRPTSSAACRLRPDCDDGCAAVSSFSGRHETFSLALFSQLLVR